MDVISYLSPRGVNLFQQWLDDLEDRRARIVILRRVDRLARGLFGDCRFCGSSVWELRIDFGPGYRVYYAMHGATMVLLLCAGSKRTQADDIERAIECWRDFLRRQYDSQSSSPFPES